MKVQRVGPTKEKELNREKGKIKQRKKQKYKRKLQEIALIFKNK